MEINMQGLSVWPEQGVTDRRNSPFRANWSATLDLLDAELHHLSAREIVLQTMHHAEDFRLDGRLRGDARKPTHPGVILGFERFAGVTEQGHSQWEQMRFPCDTFTEWKDNVRAIALALEALRKIDRYGVRSGSQYTGFKALPPGDFATTITPEIAADFIAKSAGMGNVPAIANSILANAVFAESVYKTAAKSMHPDKGGDAEEFKKLQSAWALVKELQKQAVAASG
jgi:hypothetical protein